ncbi:MAG: OmpH family outer membrane protein [Bacteroidetes bacterium]|nr:OmpH family outer membrane protein [Bacteroidota bacterium]
MKKLVKSIAILALTVGSVTFANAQKIAHISLDSLITIMPESKVAQDVAQKYLKDLESTVATMQTELETKYKDYMEKEATMSDLVKQTKQKELQDLSKRIDDFRAQAQEDYQRKYGELSKPIYDKAKKAIDAVAKENGYKYVLDTSTGVVIYSEPSDDILPLVKKKLDSMPAANIPGATPGNTTPKTPGTGTAPKTTPKTGGK